MSPPRTNPSKNMSNGLIAAGFLRRGSESSFTVAILIAICSIIYGTSCNTRLNMSVIAACLVARSVRGLISSNLV